MSSGANFFLKKALGEDFFQSLEKFELYKQGTRSVIDHEEVKTALQIVPRALMSFLIKELQPMMIGETKEIPLEITQSNPPDAIMIVTKHERDVYSGEINGHTEKYTDRKLAEFKFRSIPGVGLIILSTFEMYDVDHLEKETPEKHGMNASHVDMVQKLIDERLALHDLVSKVVDKKIAERDAVQALVLAKLSDKMHEPDTSGPKMSAPIELLEPKKDKPKMEKAEPKKKGSPLKDFLDTRTKKKPEYSVELAKGEHVSCPDCGQNIFDGKAFSGCVCLGDDMDKKIYLAKSESGVKVRFGKGWDPENIEMLLEVLRRKRG